MLLHVAQVFTFSSTGARHIFARCGLRPVHVFRTLTPVPSLLTQTRKSRGLSLAQVAAVVGTDPTNLLRVEKGEQVPKRALARKLFQFYGGAVELGAIYDPEFHAEQQGQAAA